MFPEHSPHHDTLLTTLTLCTPPPPHRWVWPTGELAATGIDPAVISSWHRHMLRTGQVLKVPPVDDAPYPQPTAYTWAPTTTPHTKLHKVKVMATKFERSSIIKWLQDNTPADGEWWNLDKFRHTGRADSYGTPIKDYNPIWLAMNQAGIKKNSAYVALMRAKELGILIYDPAHGYQWALPGVRLTPSREVLAAVTAYDSLTPIQQSAFLAAIGKPIQEPRTGATTFGDYTATIDDLREVPMELRDDLDNPFTPGYFAIDVTLRHKNKVIHQNTLKLLPTPEEEAGIREQHGAPPPKQPKVKTYNDIVPGDISDFSPEELRTMEENRRELELLNSTDFTYDEAQQ